MRHYPKNSPQAAARIVALAMLADGHVSPQELEVVERHDVHHRLGMHHRELIAVLHELCDDLLLTARLSWSDACLISPQTLADLLSDVDDPELQQRVMRACLLVTEADNVIADGESIVVDAAATQWDMPYSRPQANAARGLFCPA